MVDGNGGEPVAPPPAKKQRFGEEINRVAEIVLVLSALGRMRGGKTPTELELELMVEARSKLAGMCQEFTPNDIIGRDDIRAVIEDLGLNGKLKDQRLGLRAPKLTISEKLSLGKRKMEEAKKYLTPTVSTGYASHLSQPNGSVASSGLAKNVHVANHWPSSGVTTVNTTGSHFRMETPQMMLNNAPQGTATSSANYYAASWSAQPQSTISFSSAPDKKVPIQSSVRVPDPSFRSFMSQTPHGTFPGTNQPMQGMHYGQTSSSGNNHSEIAMIIHKVLQPRVKQYPLWNPPSREYMSRAMTCQMCEVTISEVENLLICDACEKAYHLKCLQANNMTGVPKSEWHCSRCVQAFNGKPFPPKYGRAITTTTAKVPSSTAGFQSSIARKVGSMDIKVNQQKPTVTTSPGVTTSHFETASVNAKTTASATNTTNVGSQGFGESVICGTKSPAPVSLTETPNPTPIASTSAVINNGLMSKPLTPFGTMSSTSALPVGYRVPVNATSNTIPSTPVNVSLEARAQTVTESSSTTSKTADHSTLNTDLTSQVHTLTVTSSSNSQPAVSHSETAKATEDATIGQALNADDGLKAPMENVARCENPSESTSHSVCLNSKTTLDNGQESSKDATERSVSETSQNHPTETPTTVILENDSNIIAELSVPQENSASQTEKAESQPPSASSNYHSEAEKGTPNVQDSLQNAPGNSQEGKGLNGLEDSRCQEQPSESKFDKSVTINEAKAV